MRTLLILLQKNPFQYDGMVYFKGKGKKKENIFLNDYYCHKFAIFGNRKCNENYFICPTSAISCDTIDDVDIF